MAEGRPRGVATQMEVLARLLTQTLNIGNVVTQVEPLVLSFDLQLVVFAIVIVLAGVALAALVAFLLRLWFGQWLAMAAGRSPWFNIAVVMVTTTMFMAAPAMLLVLNPLWARATGEELVSVALLGSMSNLSTNTQVITTMLALTVGTEVGVESCSKVNEQIRIPGYNATGMMPRFDNSSVARPRARDADRSGECVPARVLEPHAVE